MTPRAAPLHRRLLLLAAIAIVPLAATAGLALLALWQQQRAQAERGGIEITRALSTAIDAEINRAHSALQGIAIGPALDTGDFERYHRVMQRLLELRPGWITITLADPQGEQLLNARRPFGAKLPKVLDLPTLEAVVKSRQPAVGALTSGPGGEIAVPVRIPVVRDGAVRFVLTAAVKPEAFVQVLERQRLPPDWVVSVFDGKGQRVARSRQHEQFLGGAPAPSLAELMARGGDEAAGLTRVLEGEEVYTAYSRSPATGWTVAIGIPAGFVDGVARRSLYFYGGGVLLSLALAILAAIAIGRGAARAEAERRALLERAEKAREEAEAANRAKDAFLAMLGHELRNPLGAIANASQLLDHGQTAEYGKGVIRRQVAHLSRMTDDLLDAARAMAGKIVLQRRPLDLAAAAADALAVLRASGQTTRHRVNESLASTWVDADPVRVEQIIANLVLNAVKYSPADTTIRVMTRRTGNEAVLTVADEGIGMEATLVTRVFDPFVQGEHDLARARGGLGLGLTLVRRLARLHGGEASAASAGLGRGSEFTVRLPAIEAPAMEAVPPAAQPRVPPRDIVLVEDNEDARESLRRLLELGGHRVRVAADGPDGLAEIRARPPDLAFIDIGLPRMDGYELARQVRAGLDGRRVPRLVAVTGYGLPEDRSRALAAGFDAHLAKPVDPAAVQEVLARLG